jgi:inhibitor of KinA sporulation pathway (predicted exonuclease)
LGIQGLQVKGQRHDALADARVVMALYMQLVPQTYEGMVADMTEAMVRQMRQRQAAVQMEGEVPDDDEEEEE